MLIAYPAVSLMLKMALKVDKTKVGKSSLEISIIKHTSSHSSDQEYTHNYPANEATWQLYTIMIHISSHVQVNAMEIKYSSDVIKSNEIIQKGSFSFVCIIKQP